MSVRVCLSLNVKVVEEADGCLLLWPGRRWTCRRRAAILRALLDLLAAGLDLDAAESLDEERRAMLGRLAGLGVLRFELREHDRLMATVISMEETFSLKRPEPDARYRLSRFAFLRRVDEVMQLESPLCKGYVELHDSAALGMIQSFVLPRSMDEATTIVSRETPIDRLAAMLHGLGLLVIDGAEERNPDLRLWEFHDLLFHARSREGRSAASFGFSGRWRDAAPPFPARREGMNGERIALPRLEVADWTNGALPLAEVMESRRSCREYAEAPIALAALGEFLFRTARVRREWRMDLMEISDRPYPAAGAIYELEIHLAVDRCDALAPGLYRYDPFDHALETTPGDDAARRRLLDQARARMLAEKRPQVFVILAARCGRVAWKYDSIAYALILKDAGILLQSMSLAAEAMGLGTCIIGSGDADLFALAAGTDYLVESSVAEMALGVRKS